MSHTESPDYLRGKRDAFTEIIQHLKHVRNTAGTVWKDQFINDLITLRERCSDAPGGVDTEDGAVLDSMFKRREGRL